jgi:peptide/nickel transport system substrate-binding protein
MAAEFNSGSRVVYEKFDGYVPRSEPPSRNAGGKIAHFPRIEWQIIPDPSTAANALLKGEVDWWERPTADLHPLLKKSPDIIREVTDTTGRMAILRFNTLHPPFDKATVRQAVRLAVKQDDYMLATQGEDTTAWKTCRSLWGRGSTYYQGEQEDLMPQSLDKAKAALATSGYAGEKIVVINPADFPDIGPLGIVTVDLLKKIGMNVDLVEMDWGSVVKRRSSKDAPWNGGWSVFHTTGPVVGWGNPALNYLARGQGDSGWFGWWKDEKAEALTQEWLYAADEAGQMKAAAEMGRRGLEEAPTVPLGQFTITTAFRNGLTGMLPGSAPYPWGLKRG